MENRSNLKTFLRTRYFITPFLVLIGSIFAIFINPNTYKGALLPFTFSSNYGVDILENTNLLFFHQNPQYFTFPLIFFDISILLLVVLIFLNRKVRILDLLLLLIFFILALSAIRNVIIFTLIALPTFVYLLSNLRLSYRKGKIALVIGGFVSILLFFILIDKSSTRRVGWTSFEHSREKALDFFIKNDIKGPIYNNLDIGSYISYRLYPNEKPFVDERPEAYPKNFLSELYSFLHTNNSYFEAVSRKMKFNSVIIANYTNNPITYVHIRNLFNSPEWKLVYLNDQIVIFVRNNKNENLTEKYGMDKDNIQIAFIPKDIFGLTNLANLLRALDLNKNELEIQKLKVEINPKSCSSLARIIQLNKLLNYSGSEFLKRFQESCGLTIY